MANIVRLKGCRVDAHPLGRVGIAAIVSSHPDMLHVGAASSGKEALEAFRSLRPDVTLMDLRLPDLSGIDVLMGIRAEFPEARIIMLTTFQGDVEIRRALQGGP